jgi:queuine tRNA-ribosyltransferase
MGGFKFEVEKTDSHTGARAGRITTPHGEVLTPAFMPVGTAATVKGLTPAQVHETGAEMVLANAYHLHVRPSEQVVQNLGGLHRFMKWPGPILTDSGGYQVFSLAPLVGVDDDGVSFRSHVDGADVRFTPERCVRIQELLGADIIMQLDQCPPSDAPASLLQASVERTTRWARRCFEARTRADQWMFGINQGGLDINLRKQCQTALESVGFDGYAIGGLSVGETAENRFELLSRLAPTLPADRPRYLMGVGRPAEIAASVASGVDMFDCVMPTRNGRNAWAFTRGGRLQLRNSRHRESADPIEAECSCYACRGFSRGYLRHLFVSGEMLGPILVSLHNIAYYQRLVRRIREAILQENLAEVIRTYHDRSPDRRGDEADRQS